MVSKAVICVFVALCCAQALAAPREDFALESHSLHGTFSCIKKLTGALSVIKDAEAIYKSVKTIFADAKSEKAACASAEAATEDSIKDCKSDANSKEIQALIAEAKVLSAKAVADWPKVKAIIDECLSS